MEKGKLKEKESFELPTVARDSISFLLSSEIIEPSSVDNWQLLSNGKFKFILFCLISSIKKTTLVRKFGFFRCDFVASH